MNSSKFDLEILKRINCDKLIRILEDVPGAKDLIIDPDLLKILDRISDAKTLRAHGINKMYHLERIPPAVISTQLIYLVKPVLFNIKYIIDHLQDLKKHQHLEVHVVCCPRILSSVTIYLEEEGLYGSVFLHEFTPEFIALDEDMLSLEMYSFFKDVFVNKDFSECYSIANCLNTLESLYGSFQVVFGHGRAAEVVLKLFDTIKNEHAMKQSSSKSPSRKIGHLFVFDRDVDYVTALLTQLTYEGAVDEFYGIKAGVVEFPNSVTGSEQSLKVPLNSKEPIFKSIRNKHFGGVADHLKRRARDLMDKKESTTNMTPSEIKDFVNHDLRDMQVLQKHLSLHISACEGITKNTRKDFDVQLTTEHGLVTGSASLVEAKTYIEDCIARQLPSTLTMRLCCLYSITQEGLTRKDYENFASQLLLSHGHQHLYTLLQMKQAGLLLVSGSSEDEPSNSKQSQVLRQVASTFGVKKLGHWKAISKKLNLVPESEEIDLHNPTHMSYVFNGAYSPLIPVLISEGLTRGIKHLTELVKGLPGSTIVDKGLPGSTIVASDASKVTSRNMKVQRFKRIQRVLKFYNQYGFHSPYKVLIDGTICRAALEAKINLKEQLPKYFASPVNIVTTLCIIMEVEDLSRMLKKLFGTWLVVKQYPVHQCGHKHNRKTAVECMKSILQDNNPNRYVVATMDGDLREYINDNVVGTPIIYLHDKTPVIEKPSQLSESNISSTQKEISSQELDALKSIKSQVIGDISQEPKKKRKRGNKNPLSCLKKKSKNLGNTSSGSKKPRRRRTKKEEDIQTSIQKVFSTDAIMHSNPVY